MNFIFLNQNYGFLINGISVQWRDTLQIGGTQQGVILSPTPGRLAVSREIFWSSQLVGVATGMSCW